MCFCNCGFRIAAAASAGPLCTMVVVFDVAGRHENHLKQHEDVLAVLGLDFTGLAIWKPCGS